MTQPSPNLFSNCQPNESSRAAVSNESGGNSNIVANGKAVTVVGAGLAGSECAYQLARQGFAVTLIEMRPAVMTPAHKTANFGELVCSNSLGSEGAVSATGQLKWEALQLNSLILRAAKKHQVPAGQALAVDREKFSQEITSLLRSHPLIKIEERQIESLSELPRPCVIATGPLTGAELTKSIQEHFGDAQDFLYFFDAISPIVDADSIDYSKAWFQDRYDKGDADYLNCPLTKEQYYQFIDEVTRARKIEPKDFEKDTPFFESCMPIEEMIRRGPETLRFGPLKPVGLTNPHSPEAPYAVVQLRAENRERTAFNLVGFQTQMAFGEQTRIFKMIPGLENAEFLKLGTIHRNLYLDSPKVLNPDLSSKKDPLLFFAGQITGVEGYFESSQIGLTVAAAIKAKIFGEPFHAPPQESALGAVIKAITYKENGLRLQPTNIHFGLFPAVPHGVNPKTGRPLKWDKSKKRELVLERAKSSFLDFIQQSPIWRDFWVGPHHSPSLKPSDRPSVEVESPL